jgi:hypothetical protein
MGIEPEPEQPDDRDLQEPVWVDVTETPEQRRIRKETERWPQAMIDEDTEHLPRLADKLVADTQEWADRRATGALERIRRWQKEQPE